MTEIRIQSYFSLPTDLAGEMRDWPEFVSGQGYTVDLVDGESGEAVTVRLEGDEEQPFVVVRSQVPGRLLDRALGRVVSALSRHSDHVMVDRRS